MPNYSLPSNWLAGVASVALIASTQAAAKEAPPPTVKTQTRIMFPDVATPTEWPKPSGAPNVDTPKFSQRADVALWAGLEKFRDNDKTDRLKNQCFGPSEQPTSAFLAFLIGPLVSLFTDAVKSGLDDELKKYGADFKASEQTPYWAGSGAAAKPAWRCFRVTRLRTVTDFKENGSVLKVTRTVDFDLIGQVAGMAGDGRETGDVSKTVGLKVRPLRVYLGQPLAKGSRVAMTSSLSLEAIWRDGSEGKRSTLFTVPVFEKKFTSTGPREQRVWSITPYYFPQQTTEGAEDPDEFPNWGQVPLLPIVPWGNPGGPAATEVNVTFAAAEVGDGDGKGVLKAISTLFGKTQSDLNTLLTKAGKKLVDPEAPTPPAKPDRFCGTFTPNGDGTIAGDWTKVDGSCP